MGFRKPDLSDAHAAIRTSLAEIHSPYNDGWTASACKHERYKLKCWLESEYQKTPKFVGEEKWEQEQLIEILKQ
jgi:hypothetical protein